MNRTHWMAAAILAGALMVPAGVQIGTVAQPPPGTCSNDGSATAADGAPASDSDLWVNVQGDFMCGDLDLRNHFLEFGGSSSPTSATSSGDGAQSSGPVAGGIRFGNTELVSPSEGALSFGGDELCLDDGNCDFGDVNVTETLKANRTVTNTTVTNELQANRSLTGTAVIDRTLSVGNGSSTDNDAIFFDDGVSENLTWSDSADRYEMSNDLHVFGSLTSSSSERFKTNITNLTGALQTALALRGVEYNRTEDGRHEVGLIAEEVADVMPEVVVFDLDGDPIGLDYGRLTAVLAEAIQTQQEQIEDLREDVQKLQSPDENLERRVEELEDRLDALEQRFEEHEEKSPGHAHGNE